MNKEESADIFDSEKRILLYAFELLEKEQEERFKALAASHLLLAEDIHDLNWKSEQIAQTKLKLLNLLNEAMDKSIERRMNDSPSV